MHLGHMFNGIIKLFKKIFIPKNRIIIPLKFQHSPLPKKKLLFEFFWGDKEEFLVIWVGPILIDLCPLNARCSQKTRGVLSHRGLAIYLWRKVVCFVLFCFVVMRSTELWYASHPVLVVFRTLIIRRGAWWAWFHDIWTCGAKVLEYWMISSLKISEEMECAFGVSLERSRWIGFNGIYSVRFWLQNVGDILLIFKYIISATENSPKKFKKRRIMETQIFHHSKNNIIFKKIL
jgi:hypothetical protein